MTDSAWKALHLTSAGRRPVLIHENEKLLHIQNGVGLYQGYRIACLSRERNSQASRKERIEGHQDGVLYLTSHRLCYVDNVRPTLNSIALDLKIVDRTDLSVIEALSNELC